MSDLGALYTTPPRVDIQMRVPYIMGWRLKLQDIRMQCDKIRIDRSSLTGSATINAEMTRVLSDPSQADLRWGQL